MPDAGDFERDMDERASTNTAWGDAFAALPQETPDTGAWQRVQARLPAPAAPSRTRWPLWLATAASLALAAVIPLRMLPQSDANVPATASRVAAASTATHSPAAVATAVAVPAIASDVDAGTSPVAKRSTPRRSGRIPPSQHPIRTAAEPAEATRVATAEAAAPVDLEPLYARSAQLESLLAMARDDRVASGTTAALSDALDHQLAAIDATLVQPGLSDAQRSDLWGQRVDALQQLVGIETTNRLYAARGQRYDAALVSID